MNRKREKNLNVKRTRISTKSRQSDFVRSNETEQTRKRMRERKKFPDKLDDKKREKKEI